LLFQLCLQPKRQQTYNTQTQPDKPFLKPNRLRGLRGLLAIFFFFSLATGERERERERSSGAAISALKNISFIIGGAADGAGGGAPGAIDADDENDIIGGPAMRPKTHVSYSNHNSNNNDDNIPPMPGPPPP
jgi:hypothetical protein